MAENGALTKEVAAQVKTAVEDAQPVIEAQAKEAVDAHAAEVVKGRTEVLEAQARVTQADAKKQEVEAGTPDKTIVRIGVILLGLIVLAVVGGVLALSFHDSALNAPESLIALGAGALGALAGILTPAVRK